MGKQAQYTIRGIPSELIQAVSGSRKYADFSDLAGAWKHDPSFDQALAEQRQVDLEKWR